jgi:hypothetical protein
MIKTVICKTLDVFSSAKGQSNSARCWCGQEYDVAEHQVGETVGPRVSRSSLAFLRCRCRCEACSWRSTALRSSARWPTASSPSRRWRRDEKEGEAIDLVSRRTAETPPLFSGRGNGDFSSECTGKERGRSSGRVWKDKARMGALGAPGKG